MSDAGAARRADDRARRRPRDDRVAAGLGVRAAGARARGRARASPTEIDAGESDEYLSATINEILRLRPVLPNAEPRLTKRPIEIGGVRYPPGVVLLASAYLVHHDPEIYPEPVRVPARAVPRHVARAPTRGSRSAAGGGAAWARASRCRR